MYSKGTEQVYIPTNNKRLFLSTKFSILVVLHKDYSDWCQFMCHCNLECVCLVISDVNNLCVDVYLLTICMISKRKLSICMHPYVHTSFILMNLFIYLFLIFEAIYSSTQKLLVTGSVYPMGY